MKLLLTFLLVILFVSPTLANSERLIKNALPNYELALSSNNNGLIISAVENVVELKIRAPYLDLSKIITKLDKLSESETPEIKYKSFVVSSFLKNPHFFTWLKDKNDQEKLELMKKMLSHLEQFANKKHKEN